MSCTRAVEYTVAIVNTTRYQGMNECLCGENEGEMGRRIKERRKGGLEEGGFAP